MSVFSPRHLFLPAMIITVLYIHPSIGRLSCITINVKVQHFQRSILKAYDSEKTITKSSRFGSKYNRLATKSASSKSKSASISGSGWGVSIATSFGFSSQQSAAFDSVTSTASSMSGSRYEEKRRERTYQAGILQVFREITYQITIDRQTATEVDEDIISVVPLKDRLSFKDLQKLDEDYIKRHYGAKNTPGTYREKKCKEIKEIRK